MADDDNSGSAAIAARCLTDPEFAQQVLDGDQHPEVREAILADLAEGGEVEGFQDVPPSPVTGSGLVGPTEGPQIRASTWPSLPRPRLQGLIGGTGPTKLIDMM